MVRRRSADRVRVAAVRILARWQREHRHVEELVERAERDTAEPDYAARRRLRELVYSCVRLRGRYDHVLQVRARQGAVGAPEVRAVFWVALHELLELDRPAHAVVDEAVRVATAVGVGYARGFVNGLLRALLRDGLRSDFPAPEDARAWARTWLSHPRWLVDRWADAHGEAAMLELCAANNDRPRLYLRAAPGRRDALAGALQALGVQTVAVEFLADGLEVLTRIPPALLLAQLDEPCVIQDAAAQLVAPLLVPGQPRLLLDACAAPGGKFTHLAALLPAARVVGADLSPGRLRRLAATAARVQPGARAELLAADLVHAPFNAGSFDALLLDAPCTGTGVLARRHDARWLRRPEDPAELGALQRVLLDRALDLVRPGGVVLYATCSLEPEENDEVVDFVLAHRDDVREWPLAGELDARFLRDGRLGTWPHRHGIDGAFAARLRRNGEPRSP